MAVTVCNTYGNAKRLFNGNSRHQSFGNSSPLKADCKGVGLDCGRGDTDCND